MSKAKNPKIAKTAIIDKTANIGKGSVIWNFVQIMRNVKIGKNCVIGNGAFIDRGVIIGNNVKIHNKALIYRGVKIEDDCFIGPGVCFANDKNPRSSKIRPINKPKWIMYKGASIGANATIMPDVTIGRYAMVGAGSVVTKDVRGYGLVAGIPAKLKGYVCKNGKKRKNTRNAKAKSTK